MKKWLFATLVVAAGLVAASSTFAYNPQGGERVPKMDSETRTQLMEVLEANDYASFVDLFEGSKIAEKIDSEESFTEMAEKILAKHAEREEKMAEREEKKAEREANREAVEQALENGDYDTWKSLSPEHMTEVIDTEAKFERLQELHDLKQQAKAIAEELGLDQMKGERKGMKGHRMGGEGFGMMSE